MTGTFVPVNLGAISQQIVRGIRRLTAEDFHRELYFEWHASGKFLRWEFLPADLSSFQLVAHQIHSVSVSIIQIPECIEQDVWCYPRRKTHYFVLGPNEHFAKATRAQASDGGGPHPVESGKTLEIVADMRHFFGVNPGGSLFLLVVQEA